MECNWTVSYLVVIDVSITELLHPNWGSPTHCALIRTGSKLKTDTELNDETSEIEHDLYAFGPIGGECLSSCLIAVTILRQANKNEGGNAHNLYCDVSKS